jgi:hypothetical protein
MCLVFFISIAAVKVSNVKWLFLKVSYFPVPFLYSICLGTIYVCSYISQELE